MRSGNAKDDVIPQTYPYFWESGSDLSLQEFLTKYKPSMVQNDGTKPWIWVEKDRARKADVDMEKASEEATTLLEEVTEKVEKIQNDESIPVRANKKKGLKSKKELREEVQHDASEKLKAISVRHGWVSGKWLVFAPPDKVDLIWSNIAKSLIEGPLAPTSAFLAKVSTSPQVESPNYQHVICLYMPDVYDKDSVTEVMKVLLRKHGLNLMGVKSNLYTDIGLDSKHPSGIQSTVWKNSALMKETDIKALKEEFYAELNASKGADTDKSAAPKPEQAAPTESTSGTKSKPKLKKKVVDEDPFASEEDSVKADTKLQPKDKAKLKKLVPKKKPAQDPFESDEDEDGEEERRQALKAKKAAPVAPTGRKRSKDSSDEDEDDKEERPKKTVKRAGGR